MADSKQSISKVEDSQIVQVAGNLSVTNNTSITSELIVEVNNICQDVTRREMEHYSQIAYEKAKVYVETYSDGFAKRLSKLEENVKEKLQEPTIQLSLRKSIIGTMAMTDDDLKEESIDLMIERLQNDDKTTDRFICEKAIELLPNLSHKHLSYLALSAFFDLWLGYTQLGMEQILSSKLNPILEDVCSIDKLDLHYMSSLGCNNSVQMYMPRTNFLTGILNGYDIMFSAPCTEKEFFALYKSLGKDDAIIKNHWDAIGNHENPNRLPSSRMLKYINFSDDEISQVKLLYRSNTLDEIAQKLTNYNSNWKKALQVMNSDDSRAFYLDPVARYLGMRMLNRYVNTSLTYKIFYE